MSDNPKPTRPAPPATPAEIAAHANDQALVQRNRLDPGWVDLALTPRGVEKLGIIGCGLMGCSIAQLAIDAGLRVVMIDASETALTNARQMFADAIQTGGVTVGSSFERLGTVDMVIEAVVETLPVKKEVHQKIESSVGPEVIVATNTSSIPLASMEPHFQFPHRFCGIHFCHPELMALVEVIASQQTAHQTVADAVGFIRQLEKMPIAIGDSAGFVVNRLLAAMLNQALRLLTQGALVATIDGAMRTFGFSAGPFEMIDIIGADTCMYAGRTMWEHKMKCVSLSPVLPRMVKLGRLGRKKGAGFYAYPDPRGEALHDEELAPLIAPYCKSVQDDSHASAQSVADTTQMVLEVLAPVVLEATRLIEEGIVKDPRDIDLAFTHGLSFPQSKGGLLYWADETGIATLVEVLNRLVGNDGRLAPGPVLLAMLESNRRFY